VRGEAEHVSGWLRTTSSIVGKTYDGDTLAQGSEEGYSIPQLGEKHC
jgi:hypothetical protein